MNLDDLRQHELRVRNALARDRRLSALDHRIAERMIGYLNWRADSRSFGLAWPSAERLAQEVGAQTRSVRRSLRRLLDLGVLVVASAGGGRRCTTRYQLGPIGLENSDRPRLKTVTDEAQNSDRPRLKTVTVSSPDTKEEIQEEGETRARRKTIGFDDFEFEAETVSPAEPWHSTSLDEWYPGPDVARWAAENVPSVDDPLSPRRVDRFKRWHRARGTTRFADCNEAFRSWLEDQPAFDRDRRQREMLLPIGGGGAQSDAEIERATNMRVWKETEVWLPHWGPQPDAGEEVA